MLDGLNQLLALVIAGEKTEGGTMLVPGHGRVSDEADLVEYRDMVTIIRDRIQDMVKRGYDAGTDQSREPDHGIRRLIRERTRLDEGSVRRSRLQQPEARGSRVARVSDFRTPTTFSHTPRTGHGLFPTRHGS